MNINNKRKGRAEKVLSQRKPVKDWGRQPKWLKERERERVIKVLENLFWKRPDLYYQLCCYYESRERPKPESMKELKALGLINDKDQIDAIPHDVLWEMLYGEKPYWAKTN
jgi:hypothetical protein